MSDPLRVVVVDDAEEIRDAFSMVLARHPDFVVVAAADDGQSGISAVSEHRPDVVILDFAMPDLDGLQVLTAIRHASPETTVILVSGYPETVLAADAVEYGAHGFIRKGVDASEFVGTIREVVEHRAEKRARSNGQAGTEDELRRP
jgi:DNA-binding NarL/FixJ family response regulator